MPRISLLVASTIEDRNNPERASRGKNRMGEREIREMGSGKAPGQDQPRDIVHTHYLHTYMHAIPE